MRRPVAADAAMIFSRYASDAAVTRYLAWRRHHSIADSEAFLAFSDAEWERWPAGPFLIESAADGELLGSTGLGFEESALASTGYVLAQDAWGRGYATEACAAMVELAARLGVGRLIAWCHREHRASARVLEKLDFTCEELLERHMCFPNLGTPEPQDCWRFARLFA